MVPRAGERWAGPTTTVQHQEQEQRRSSVGMDNGTPKATERSEGGSDRRRTRRRAATYTEQVMVRLDKPTLIELETLAVQEERNVAQIIRRAIAKELRAAGQPEPETA